MIKALPNSTFRSKTILFFLFCCTLILSSCKNYVRLTVSEPPVVFVSQNVQAVGLVNRSFLTGGGSAVEVIDAGLSLEGPELDREGSNAMVTGCHDRLVRMQRFEKVAILDSMTNESGTPGMMPAQMSWEEVERICLENDVQLLFVLEMFDTDTKINYDTRTKNVAGPLGTEIPVLQHRAAMRTNIFYAWRLYDPSNKIIADWVNFRDHLSNQSAWTINPVQAAAGLIGRKDAVKQISRNNGENYASRIEEIRLRVRRQYFTRGSRDLRTAHRRALVGDWDGAAELWEKETNSPKRKVAGRATYNMAIISEIRGELDAAVNYAQTSYTDYNRRMGRDYARILVNRQQRLIRAREIQEEDRQN